MPPRSHYDVLQLDSRSATPDEVKRAFRRLSMELHPDKNGNSEESKRAFQEINEAYTVLGDPEKRGNYDFELQMGIGGHRIHMGGMGPMGMGMGMGGMGSINPLDMLFAAMHQHQQPQHQQHQQQSPQGNRNQAQHMFEAMFGGMGGMGPKIIIHNFTQNMAEEREEHEVHEAHEAHEVHEERSYDVNVVISVALSDAFRGMSQHPVTIQYEDESHSTHSETVLINVPPGIPDGYTVGIPGKGNVVPHTGGRRGTLRIELSIDEHPRFQREGDADLVVEHRASLKDALCGFTFDVAHLNGRSYKFNCKPCSITGSMNETKVLPGLGYNESGALKIRFSIELPASLTEEQVAALAAIL